MSHDWQMASGYRGLGGPLTPAERDDFEAERAEHFADARADAAEDEDDGLEGEVRADLARTAADLNRDVGYGYCEEAGW